MLAHLIPQRLGREDCVQHHVPLVPCVVPLLPWVGKRWGAGYGSSGPVKGGGGGSLHVGLHNNNKGHYHYTSPRGVDKGHYYYTSLRGVVIT